MEIEVHHDPQARKYFARIDGQESLLQYREAGDRTLDYWRTFVPVPLRGRGIAEEIVRVALEDALREGNRIIPTCWFVDVYIRRHRRYQELVLEAPG